MTTEAAEVTPQRWVEPAEGQRWTFVHSSGKQTEYVVTHAAPNQGGKAGPVTLLNEETGKQARITQHWLSRPAEEGVSHWLPPEAA